MESPPPNRDQTGEAAIGMMDWDDEVDVVCVGSGGGMIAAGVLAARAGLEVYVGVVQSPSRRNDGCGRPWGSDLAARLGVDDAQEETIGHLAKMVEEFAPVVADDGDVTLPVRILEPPAPPEPPASRRRSSPLEPFYGGRLGAWARRCAASANGVLYHRVTRRHLTNARAASGVSLEVGVIGPVGAASPASGLTAWLHAQACAEDVEVDAVDRLERLVFEEGELVGVVVQTAEGPLAIRAHRDIVIGIGDPVCHGAPGDELTGVASDMRLCLVSQFASRFGRLELVSSPPVGTRAIEHTPSRVYANGPGDYSRRP